VKPTYGNWKILHASVHFLAPTTISGQPGEITYISPGALKFNISTEGLLWVILHFDQLNMKMLTSFLVVDRGNKPVGKLVTWIDGAKVRRGGSAVKMELNPILTHHKDTQVNRMFDDLLTGRTLGDLRQALLVFEGRFPSLDGLFLQNDDDRKCLKDK
jgi:hypothetical protein